MALGKENMEYGYVYRYGKNLLDAVKKASFIPGIKHNACIPRKTEEISEDEFVIFGSLNFCSVHLDNDIIFHELDEIKPVIIGLKKERAQTGKPFGEKAETLIKFYQAFMEAKKEKDEDSQKKISMQYKSWIYQQLEDFEQEKESE